MNWNFGVRKKMSDLPLPPVLVTTRPPSRFGLVGVGVGSMSASARSVKYSRWSFQE